LFKIDRNFVKIAGTKRIQVGKDEESEVGAAGESLDAATSAAIMDSLEQEQADDMLSAAEIEAKSRAEQIIIDARDDAAHILITARDEAEEERTNAWQEGFTEGSEEGRRSYDEKLADKMREDDEMLKRVMNEFYEERERRYNELEDEVIKLAIEIVRKIINPAEEALGDVFESLIKNALRQTPTDGKPIIRVSPVEYERFFSSGAATLELDSGVTVHASVIRDVSLNEGDCIIDTEDITVNAGIDSQLKYVKLAFERANQYEPD